MPTTPLAVAAVAILALARATDDAALRARCGEKLQARHVCELGGKCVCNLIVERPAPTGELVGSTWGPTR